MSGKPESPNRCRSAVTYPMVMLIMMLVVVAVLLSKVLPVFQQVFTQLGAEMNWASRSLMEFGNVLNRYRIVLIPRDPHPGSAGAVPDQNPERTGPARFSQRPLPFSRKFADLTASCQFCRRYVPPAFSSFSPEESISMAGRLSEGTRFQKKLQDCLEKLGETGEGLVRRPHSIRHFHWHLWTDGSCSSRKPVPWMKSCRISQSGMRERTGRTSALPPWRCSEPTLVAVLSVITGVILLSVMLPLMGIYFQVCRRVLHGKIWCKETSGGRNIYLSVIIFLLLIFLFPFRHTLSLSSGSLEEQQKNLEQALTQGRRTLLCGGGLLSGESGTAFVPLQHRL